MVLNALFLDEMFVSVSKRDCVSIHNGKMEMSTPKLREQELSVEKPNLRFRYAFVKVFMYKGLVLRLSI